MRITRVADWILFSTSRFDEQVAYLRDVLGMPLERQGPAVVDHHFRRYTLFAQPDGVTLEVVEVSPSPVRGSFGPRRPVGEVARIGRSGAFRGRRTEGGDIQGDSVDSP